MRHNIVGYDGKILITLHIIHVITLHSIHVITLHSIYVGTPSGRILAIQ